MSSNYPGDRCRGGTPGGSGLREGPDPAQEFPKASGRAISQQRLVGVEQVKRMGCCRTGLGTGRQGSPGRWGQTQRFWVAKGQEEGERSPDSTLHSRSPSSNEASAKHQAGCLAENPVPLLRSIDCQVPCAISALKKIFSGIWLRLQGVALGSTVRASLCKARPGGEQQGWKDTGAGRGWGRGSPTAPKPEPSMGGADST